MMIRIISNMYTPKTHRYKENETPSCIAAMSVKTQSTCFVFIHDRNDNNNSNDRERERGLSQNTVILRFIRVYVYSIYVHCKKYL